MQPSPAGPQLGSSVTLRDSEMLPITLDTLVVVKFCPKLTGLTRLDREGDKWTRYIVHSVNISFKAVESTTTAGQITWGILPGPQSSEVTTAATILALRPHAAHAVWKSTTINLGRGIMPQRELYCNDATRDGVAFCLYYLSTVKTGYFQFSYNISFSYPNP